MSYILDFADINISVELPETVLEAIRERKCFFGTVKAVNGEREYWLAINLTQLSWTFKLVGSNYLLASVQHWQNPANKLMQDLGMPYGTLVDGERWIIDRNGHVFSPIIRI